MRSLSTPSRSSLAFAALALAALPLAVEAQSNMPGMLEPDPEMPVKEGFDTGRAIFWERPNFTPYRDPVWEPLRDALAQGRLEEDTPVLLFAAGGETLALLTREMSYHHVAQGEMRGEPWMVTF